MSFEFGRHSVHDAPELQFRACAIDSAEDRKHTEPMGRNEHPSTQKGGDGSVELPSGEVITGTESQRRRKFAAHLLDKLTESREQAVGNDYERIMHAKEHRDDQQ